MCENLTVFLTKSRISSPPNKNPYKKSVCNKSRGETINKENIEKKAKGGGGWLLQYISPLK